jgi:hypothetical protein
VARSREAYYFVVPSGLFRCLCRRPLVDHLHLQFPAGFFPIRRVNVPDDGYRTIVLIRCAITGCSAKKKLWFPEVGERSKPFPKYSGLPSADTFDGRYKIFLVGRGVGNRGHGPVFIGYSRTAPQGYHDTRSQQAEARRRRAEGATLAELARSYGVGKSTISRLNVALEQANAETADKATYHTTAAGPNIPPRNHPGNRRSRW